MAKNKSELEGMEDRKNIRGVKLKVGAVLKTTLMGGRTPVVVYKESFDPEWGKGGMTTYGIATQERVAVGRMYTAYQLEAMGYTVVGMAKGFDPGDVKEPEELPPLTRSLPTPPAGASAEQPTKGRKTAAKKDAPETVQDARGGAGGSGGGADVDPAPQTPRAPAQFDLLMVLNAFVFGVQPENEDSLARQLDEAGIDRRVLVEEVREVIGRHHSMAVGRKGKQ